MVRFPDVTVDPWFMKQDKYTHYKRIPEEAVFICAYLVFMNPVDFGESVFFRRIDSTDELWVATWDVELKKDYMEIEHDKKELFEVFGCAVTAPSEGTIKTACQNLLTHLFRARENYNYPSDFVREGMVSETEFNHIVQFVKDEIASYAQQAEENKSEIVETAEELSLYPRPDGSSPYGWIAQCPRTSHHLYISTKSNTFGCGWCKIKGGSAELREFVQSCRSKRF